MMTGTFLNKSNFDKPRPIHKTSHSTIRCQNIRTQILCKRLEAFEMWIAKITM